MYTSLSSIQPSPLSATFVSAPFTYLNSDRAATHPLIDPNIPGMEIDYPVFSSNFRGVTYSNDGFTFLTDVSPLSAYLNTSATIGPLSLGYAMVHHNSRYDWTTNTFMQVGSAVANTQYMGIVDKSNKFNLLPLKTRTDINGNPSSLPQNYRDYQKIYRVGDTHYLQFKVDMMPVELRPDQYTPIYNAYDIEPYDIDDSAFVAAGAVGGDSPLNSDVIFFRLDEYGRYTNNGPDNVNVIHNGAMLCMWLSSQTYEASSTKVWMERWYDPIQVSQGAAFIAQKNVQSTSFSYISDIPSDKVISGKEKMVYLRYGPERNNTHVQTLSTNLRALFDTWDHNFESTTNNLSGFIVGDYIQRSDTLVLDGTRHAHIPPESAMFVDNEMTVGVWANTNDWNTNNDSQFFGNYYNESGYGIFYNTGTSNNLISLPTSADNLFTLNDRGFKVFEKDIKSDLGLDCLAINYIKTDLFGNRWIYDSCNNKLYKLENDDLIVKTVDLPANADIAKIECNSNNEIYVLDVFNHQMLIYDSGGILMDTHAVDEEYNNFDIDVNDDEVLDHAQFMTINSQSDVVKTIGPTLYINDVPVLYLNDLPQSLRLDLDDNIWVIFGNQILKTDKNGVLLFNTKLELSFVSTDAEMCFVKTHKNNKEQIHLWIVFNKAKQVVILNLEGRTIKRLDLTALFVGRYCGTFQLNIVGDFTGFDNKRKFETVDGKVVSSTNPSVCVRMGLRCGTSRKIIQMHHSTRFLKSWTHLAFTLARQPNVTTVRFYVDGLVVSTKTLNDNYHIDYGHRSSPFIIGGISGKLGARNLERSIIKSGFFIGEIDDVRIYNIALNGYEMKSLSLHNHYYKWSPISFYTKIPETTLIEEVDTIHINRYKGFKSNHFNIKIRNFTNNVDLQELTEKYIRDNISNFIPAHTVLNDIKFE